MQTAIKIYKSPLEMNQNSSFFELSNYVNGNSVYLKLEGLNPSGSIKIKPALKMIESLEREGEIHPKIHTIIESSSGNLGIALSLVCKMKGYKFICVSDPNINELTTKYIKLYGAELIIVQNRDENGGFLGTRINLIHKMLSENLNYVWLNQYRSENNVTAHFEGTAKEIFESITQVDYLFVGVGTSGTIMGCQNFIKKNSLRTKLIAVDAQGSVSFGSQPGKRLIPGLGTSRKPEILTCDQFDDIVLIPEDKTITTCRYIFNKYGILLGGSSGSVLAGVAMYQPKLNKNSLVVAISPDFGDKYIDTIYNDDWVRANYTNLSV